MQKIRLICSIFLFLFCSLQNSFSDELDSLLLDNTESAYANAIKQFYPKIELVQAQHTSALQYFSEGKSIEALEVQISALLEASDEYRFYPHYIKTIVIAIDRDQTDVPITSFKDLLQSNLPLNCNFGEESAYTLWTLPQAQHIVLSMAMAIYGSYDIHAIAKDFNKLNKSGRFFCNNTSKPISILYDTEAVELIKQGRNIEIVIPKDGTISFVSGIFTNTKTSLLSYSFDSLLVENGLRTANNESQFPYPYNGDYEHAYFVSNFTEFNRLGALVGPIMRREAFEHERYGFSDNKERSVFFLCFVILMVFYIISLNRRLTHKKIRTAIVTVCSLQIMLITMGCLKALIVDRPILETILWYGYYLAFIFIPSIYLYVAILSGKNKEMDYLPKPYIIHLGISVLLVLFVCTNNFHGLVFIVYNYMNSTFDYNIGYYVVMAWVYTTVCGSLGILMYKVFLMPRKSTLLLPLLMNFFTIIFMIGYARRIPLFYDFDFAYSINIIILLYMEACIQSKLFPVNNHYRKMFTNSSLCMEIHDKYDAVIVHSLTSPVSKKDYILRETKMLSGSFLYYEDYRELNKARDELNKTNTQLKKNNTLLKKKAQITAERASLAAEKAVYKTIDSILSQEMSKIDQLLFEMKKKTDTHRLMVRINIVVCGIKRKCILRISTLYKKTQAVSDFLNSIGEMQEFAKLLPLKITIGCTVSGEIALMQSMRMYEVFCNLIEVAAEQECRDILVQLYEETDTIVFSVIPDKAIDTNYILKNVKNSEDELQGLLYTKDWDDSTAILLSFPVKKDPL